MPRYLVSLVGQSNELGSGPSGSKSRVGGLGAPMIDTGNRSWWPACVEAMAQRGAWLTVANTAIGSTSLTEQWVGRARAWVSGKSYGVGGYAISGGSVLKKTSAGVQNSTTTPAAGTGADGITWALARAVTAADTDGALYLPGDALHDPNGYIAAALAALSGKPGYDAKGVYVSIGQGDHTVESTVAQYSQAMQIVAGVVTALGYRCWLGVTCGMSGADAPTIAARDATMTGVIQAGQQAALAALSSNPLVSAGADLRAALGVPTATAVDTTRNAVNNSDYLHLTSATYDQAGAYVAAAFAAGGW